MSIIAGKIAVQVGTHLLHQPVGGKGKLLGGLPSTERGKVVVFGAGQAGGDSAALAAAGGANVVVFEKRQDRMEEMMRLGNNVTALYPYDDVVAREVAEADLVIGAVLVTGAKAPHVVTREMLKDMEDGSVVVDISIDQGGCFETSRPTTWKEPTYVEEGVTHFCVTNMPGAVPQTSLAGDLRGDPAVGQQAGLRPVARQCGAGAGHQCRRREAGASGAARHESSERPVRVAGACRHPSAARFPVYSTSNANLAEAVHHGGSRSAVAGNPRPRIRAASRRGASG